ncbi:MAG: hypothetical protein JXA82_13790 [Sedimentisphaerales bacterium]|nr:hypothetical protein [Sedimentisphaerales bacterium]
MRRLLILITLGHILACCVWAGPYTDPGIIAYLVSEGGSIQSGEDPNFVLHPIFRGWATGWKDYMPSDDILVDNGEWGDPKKALGSVTGNNYDIVSLGDLDAEEIAIGKPPGTITLIFGDPNVPDDPNGVIRNSRGYDFAVFENAFVSLNTFPSGSITGQMFAELAFVEVSSDGEHFARFPSVSLTESAVGRYGTIQISDVHNLAGKHPNSYKLSMGTPFDLSDLLDHPLVLQGLVDLGRVRYVRLVDIPGTGDWRDEAPLFVDPTLGIDRQSYASDHPIYDVWLTFGSGGFDLEAVGVLHEQRYAADINLDGTVDFQDFALLSGAYRTQFGQAAYSSRCDMADQDLRVTPADLIAFSQEWLCEEEWRVRAE